ncbi:spore germination protein [Chakrabartyella piscis]|uniref:spore germination protein n=1 Tax=Chakrabartyella piscis TaxID=2918914 RepID=UPI002958530C|nr:spore germination protein [Chakrabartyella piscis]
MEILKTIGENKEILTQLFLDCEDIVMREFAIGGGSATILMVYTDNMVDGDTVQNFIMTNLMNRSPSCNEGAFLDELMADGIAVRELSKIQTIEDVVATILCGDTALFMDGDPFALRASTRGFPNRGVNQAQTEVVVQGPKDAFTEVVAFNVVLIRRRIQDAKLKVKRKKLGTRSNTDICILYMEDLVRPEILNRVTKQLETMDALDVVLDSGSVEQLLENSWKSPFPQLQMTERPDKASSALLEGRVVLAIDNSPFVILLPATLNVFFQAAEDYYDRFAIMSFIRAMRYVAAFGAIGLSGLYIAFAVFHPELLPTPLAIKIASTRQNIPFSLVGEVIAMELAFELLREAGIRLPSPVSSTIGIVGGIIIGQAAVEAGIVSPVVVIVTALTGICGFVIPNIALVSGLRLTKYFVILLSATFGLFGFWLSMLVLVAHLSGLTSYGIPYLYPFCSSVINNDVDWEDSIWRLPLRKMKDTPIFMNPKSRKGDS